MLLLFNKTIKPLNQFAEKIKKSSVFGATVDDFLYHFWQNIFPKFLWNLALCKISEKGKTSFGFIQQAKKQKWQQHLLRKTHNVGKKYNNNFKTAY